MLSESHCKLDASLAGIGGITLLSMQLLPITGEYRMSSTTCASKGISSRSIPRIWRWRTSPWSFRVLMEQPNAPYDRTNNSFVAAPYTLWYSANTRVLRVVLVAAINWIRAMHRRMETSLGARLWIMYCIPADDCFVSFCDVDDCHIISWSYGESESSW